jgi:phage FluMu protein Com
VAFDEKAYFQEKPESRVSKLPCPRCKRVNEYSLRWMRRTKRKDRQPQGEDRAKFEKLRDHLLRLDDEVTCKTCGKKFEVPSHQSMMFLDQLEGLPKDEEVEELEAEQRPAAPIDRSKLPARFTRPTKGWRGE